jgi:hypothetical protein
MMVPRYCSGSFFGFVSVVLVGFFGFALLLQLEPGEWFRDQRGEIALGAPGGILESGHGFLGGGVTGKQPGPHFLGCDGQLGGPHSGGLVERIDMANLSRQQHRSALSCRPTYEKPEFPGASRTRARDHPLISRRRQGHRSVIKERRSITFGDTSRTLREPFADGHRREIIEISTP